MAKISNICDIITEKIKLNEAINNNLCNTYISTENMLPNKAGITSPLSFPSSGNITKYEKNDVLISNIRPYFKKIWKANTTGVCSNDVIVFRAKENVNSDYLFYNLSSDSFFDYATKTSKGTKMPRGDKKAIMEYDIPFKNNYIEQVKSSIILRKIDDLIAINNDINNNLEQQAQALYQQMFIENPSPKWVEGTLKDIANITMGQSPNGSSYNEDKNGTIFFQGRAEFGFRFPSIRLYTTEPKRMASANDILMSVRAPVGDLNVAHKDCCIGRGLAAIHSKSNQQSFMLYTMFALKKQLDIFNGEGTVFGSINRNSLNDMPIIIPSDKAITEFESIVAPMDAAIRNNYDKICRLLSMRDSLLPRLMSGQLDVSDIDI